MFDPGPEEQEVVGGSGGLAASAGSVGPGVLEAFEAALSGLAAWDPTGERPGPVLDAYVRLRGVRDRFDAELARVGAVVDEQGEWRADGSKSLAARVARAAREPDQVARRDVRLARLLAQLPATAAAFARGEISRSHVDALLHAAAGPRRTLYRRDEAMLLGFARDLRGLAFSQAVRTWALAADDDLAPDDPGPLDLDAVGLDARRWFAVHEQADGRCYLQGELGRLDGAQFVAALRRVDGDLFRADWEHARARLGRDPNLAELRRTPTQRRADAIVELMIRGSSARPGAKRPEPLVTVLMGSDAHARLLQLSRGTPITLREGLRAMLDGVIERATFETPNRIQISRKSRLFRGATRRAVQVRAITCEHVFTSATGPDGAVTVEDRCEVPSDECEVDHVIPWEDGGPTTQENGGALCVDHHPGRRTDQPWLTDGPKPRATRRRGRRRRRGRDGGGSHPDGRPP